MLVSFCPPRLRPAPLPVPSASEVFRFAAAFGAGVCFVRRSPRSLSGWVAVCSFWSPVAPAFAVAAAARFGFPFCVVRPGSRRGSFRVSVPCLPPAPFAVHLRSSVQSVGGVVFVSRRWVRLFCRASSLPSVVVSSLASASVVGFSGSRSPAGVLPPAVVSAAVAAVPASVPVSVGCARGVDAVVRAFCPRARVFSVASGDFGLGRGAFAARSVACVRSVAVPSGVWVSFPCSPCPAGLVPSASSSRAFSGSGSGSWASLAFALGSGVRCLVWLPTGVVAPAGWGLSPVGGGWWVSVPSPVQLSLF